MEEQEDGSEESISPLKYSSRTLDPQMQCWNVTNVPLYTETFSGLVRTEKWDYLTTPVSLPTFLL
jgi:hypothetical protein